jgi:hypothetical protein
VNLVGASNGSHSIVAMLEFGSFLIVVAVGIVIFAAVGLGLAALLGFGASLRSVLTRRVVVWFVVGVIILLLFGFSLIIYWINTASWV